MPITLALRKTPVLSHSPRSAARTTSPSGLAPARGFQVLQSKSAPAQLCLFLRSGALDVK